MEFKRLYPEQFVFFSKTELAERKSMPKLLPDAYVKRINVSQTKANDYFLASYETATYYLQLQRKIREYINYAESETWENTTDRKLPTILMVCETKALQRRMMKLASKELEKTYVDLTFIATTKSALAEAHKDENIWTDAAEPEQSSSLSDS